MYHSHLYQPAWLAVFVPYRNRICKPNGTLFPIQCTTFDQDPYGQGIGCHLGGRPKDRVYQQHTSGVLLLSDPLPNFHGFISTPQTREMKSLLGKHVSELCGTAWECYLQSLGSHQIQLVACIDSSDPHHHIASNDHVDTYGCGSAVIIHPLRVCHKSSALCTEQGGIWNVPYVFIACWTVYSESIQSHTHLSFSQQTISHKILGVMAKLVDLQCNSI